MVITAGGSYVASLLVRSHREHSHGHVLGLRPKPVCTVHPCTTPIGGFDILQQSALTAERRIFHMRNLVFGFHASAVGKAFALKHNEACINPRETAAVQRSSTVVICRGREIGSAGGHCTNWKLDRTPNGSTLKLAVKETSTTALRVKPHSLIPRLVSASLTKSCSSGGEAVGIARSLPVRRSCAARWENKRRAQWMAILEQSGQHAGRCGQSGTPARNAGSIPNPQGPPTFNPAMRFHANAMTIQAPVTRILPPPAPCSVEPTASFMRSPSSKDLFKTVYRAPDPGLEIHIDPALSRSTSVVEMLIIEAKQSPAQLLRLPQQEHLTCILLHETQPCNGRSCQKHAQRQFLVAQRSQLARIRRV
ncbi:hypothetical protein L1887_53943 [Cichorium endivia]|nr:hypothetical protein L1887_53943 [Cichorium endivia]